MNTFLLRVLYSFILVLSCTSHITYPIVSYYALENKEGKQVLILGDRHHEQVLDALNESHVNMLLTAVSLYSSTPLPCLVECGDSVKSIFESGTLPQGIFVGKTVHCLAQKARANRTQLAQKIQFIPYDPRGVLEETITGIEIALAQLARQLTSTSTPFPPTREWAQVKLNAARESSNKFSLKQYFILLQDTLTKLQELKIKHKSLPFEHFYTVFEQGKQKIEKQLNHISLETQLELALFSLFDTCKTGNDVKQQCLLLNQLVGKETSYMYANAFFLDKLLTLTTNVPYKALAIVGPDHARVLVDAYIQLGYTLKQTDSLTPENKQLFNVEHFVLFEAELQAVLKAFLLNVWESKEHSTALVQQIASALQTLTLGTPMQQSLPSESSQHLTCNTCGKSSTSLLLCSRCHNTRYCNKECQRIHWPSHKTNCKTT